ncbi:hypothetical protein [Proteus phage 3H10_20]|uniref:Uncharacterized protein n=1 Tax=Proteus phage 3H10_20 TaxID=2772448 RepID=A0A7L7SGJ4_9CAUD|nr:hypothetical protein PQC37_gp115 [Proteus phage 3H10_20]QOC54906.1 hypothetical protein [Proteus phage 3H10_20]
MSMVVLNVFENIFSDSNVNEYAVCGKIYVKRKIKRNCLQVTVKLYGKQKEVKYLENFRFDSKNNNMNKLYGAIRHTFESLKGVKIKLHSGEKSNLLL